mgnify:CR=1 FL=1
MIQNIKEYQVTKDQVAKFERGLAELSVDFTTPYTAIERDAMLNALTGLRSELTEYDALWFASAGALAEEILSELDEGRPEATRIVPLAQTVQVLLEKIRKLRDMVDLADPHDPIGAALTQVGL